MKLKDLKKWDNFVIESDDYPDLKDVEFHVENEKAIKTYPRALLEMGDRYYEVPTDINVRRLL